MIIVGAIWTMPVRAAHYAVNLNDLGPAGALHGPCYCSTSAGFLSQTYWFAPGDVVDFGHVTIYPLEAYSSTFPRPYDPAPPRVFVLSSVGVSYNYSIPNPPPTTITFEIPPDPFSVDLIFTILEGSSQITLGWYGTYDYVAPVPEAATWTMMIVGFAGIGFMIHRQRETIALAA
jgi:hypothetical protein